MTLHQRLSRTLHLLVPFASAAALALLGVSPTAHAEAIAPQGAETPLKPAQMRVLHLMDPALHAGMGRLHGLPFGPHDCPHDCAQSPNGPPITPMHVDNSTATVNKTLTIKTPEGTRTITMADVVHGGDAPCFWPIGGSINLSGADNVAHVAICAATCGHVTLDGAGLALPTIYDHGHGHGPGHHRFGSAAASAPLGDKPAVH